MSRVVLVTAGAAGIGRAIVRRFVEAGDVIHVCDVAQESLDDLALELPDVHAHRADVAVRADLDALFDAIGDRLDVLVNNAGIGGPRAAIEATDEDAWDQTVAVNLNGAFYAARRAAQHMIAGGGGAIVNISTATVRTGLPMRTAYVASKHGLMGLTQNLARELGPSGIRCNAVLPGPIDNPRGRALVQRMAEERGESVETVEAEMLRYVSMRCWIDPDEVAQMVVFLASDAARHVTGQFIAVDGGVEWES